MFVIDSFGGKPEACGLSELNNCALPGKVGWKFRGHLASFVIHIFTPSLKTADKTSKQCRCSMVLQLTVGIVCTFLQSVACLPKPGMQVCRPEAG